MMRILIAEDEEVSRRVLEATLVKWGYEVIVTSDGNDALLELRKPDAPLLAVLDVLMPGMNGIEVCRTIRMNSEVVPPYLILLTSRSDKKDIVQGLEAGANDYITKPFDHEELR